MPFARLTVAFLLIAGLVFGVFGALVGVGQLSLGLGLAAATGLTLVLSAALAGYLRGIGALLGGLERLGDDPEAPPPPLVTHSPIIRDLWQAALRLQRKLKDAHQATHADLSAAEALIAALPEPLLMIDERRELVRVNRAARELFPGAAPGRDLLTAIRHPGVIAAVDATLAEGKPRAIEFALTIPVERAMRAALEPVVRPDGSGGLLITMTDLTQIKRTEQMRADFVANASHELRTPLSTLIGFIETLQGPAARDLEAQRRFLPIMHQQATRMARLVEDLLSLSRIELNEHQPPTGQVGLVEVLSLVGHTLELKAAARSMDLELPDETANGPIVLGDADELQQVFQNLIDNAIKYARPGTAVSVTLGRSQRLRDGVAVAVRDRGEGIDRRHLPRLTERFYRVDSARSRELGGTGLGLAIVKHIVSRHRGQLEIDSTPGEGSVFTVHLRAAQPHDQAPGNPRATPLSVNGRS